MSAVKSIDMSLVTDAELALAVENGKALTTREHQALAAKRGGISDKEFCELVAEVNTPNQVGNYRRSAEEKLGIRSASARGGKKVAISSADDFMKSTLAGYEAAIESARKRVDTLTESVDTFDVKEVVKSMKSDLTAKAARLRTEADEIDARVKRPAKDWTDEVEAARTALVNEVDTAKATLKTAESELTLARTAIEAAVAQIEAGRKA